MKVALITGSTSGIGQAVSRHLAQQGYTLVLHYFSHEEVAQQLFQEIQKISPQSIVLQANLADYDQALVMFMQLQETFTTIDVVVNTVGIFGKYCALQEMKLQEFKDILDSNLFSVFTTIQLAIPLLQPGQGKSIVNFSSVSAEHILARKFTTPYYIAKAGVEALTKSWARELASKKIRVNTLALGIVENAEMQLPMPMGRPVTMHDITQAIDFLLDSKSEYISGASLEINGGWTPYQ